MINWIAILALWSVAVWFFVQPAYAQDDLPSKVFMYSGLTYLWIALWAALGGAVSFYQKVKSGASRAFNFTELIGELATSAFVGIVTFMLCDYARIDPRLSAVFIAVTGHMGSRAIFIGEKLLQKYLAEKVGVVLDADGNPPAQAAAETKK